MANDRLTRPTLNPALVAGLNGRSGTPAASADERSGTSTAATDGGSEGDLPLRLDVSTEAEFVSFVVMRYRGNEGLNRLYRFEIEVSSPFTDIDMSSIVGAPAWPRAG